MIRLQMRHLIWDLGLDGMTVDDLPADVLGELPLNGAVSYLP